MVLPGIANPTANVPFCQIATPASTGVRILRVELGVETAAATSAQVVLFGMRRTTASTHPTAATLAALSENDPATLLTKSTTACAYGIATVTGTAATGDGANGLHRWPVNVLNGVIFTPSFDEQIFIKPSSWWTLQFTTTLTVTIGGHIILQEVD
jgi:hypothetical protein